MTLWHSVVPQYALTGHIMPVAEQMFNLGMLDKDDFSPALLDSVAFDGEVYPVPFDNYGSGLYVNTNCWNAPVSRLMTRRKTAKSSLSMYAA